MVAFQEIADKYITADIPGKLFAGFGFGIAQIQNNVTQVVFVGTLAEALAFKSSLNIYLCICRSSDFRRSLFAYCMKLAVSRW